MQAFYNLPPERIAQDPPAVRGQSRLLVVERKTGHLSDKHYSNVVDYLKPGDVVVLNDTKVLPARLIARLPDGRERELMLTESHGRTLSTRAALVVYRGKLRAGDELYVGKDKLRVLEIRDGGQALVSCDRPFEDLAEQHGVTPLPPYIRRAARAADRERYQTVFAATTGSVAAPTASLNLTDELLAKIEEKRVRLARLTLHVGRGTFLPVRSDNLADHTMHEEYFEIPEATVMAIRRAKAQDGRIIAIGTTVTRALEYAADDILHGSGRNLSGEADIFIYPGYKFKLVDVLLTNFHAPDSTVIQLAAAFAGSALLKRAYTHALEHDYSFLSYGDSMLITS